jgi:hypothetical protein
MPGIENLNGMSPLQLSVDFGTPALEGDVLEIFIVGDNPAAGAGGALRISLQREFLLSGGTVTTFLGQPELMLLQTTAPLVALVRDGAVGLVNSGTNPTPRIGSQIARTPPAAPGALRDPSSTFALTRLLQREATGKCGAGQKHEGHQAKQKGKNSEVVTLIIIHRRPGVWNKLRNFDLYLCFCHPVTDKGRARA